MKIKIFRILVMVLCFYITDSRGQQIALIDHVYMAPHLINPARTGLNGNKLMLVSRDQWVGVKGAPKTYLASFDGSLKKSNIGLGLAVSSDIANILGRKTISASYRYGLKLSKDHDLNFGLSFAAAQYQLLFDQIHSDEPQEITLINSTKQESLMDADFGIHYRNKLWNVGLAAFQLMQNQHQFSQDNASGEYQFQYRPHFSGTISRKIIINEKSNLEPMVLIRSNSDLEYQLEGLIKYIYKEKLTTGIRYRDEFGVSFFGSAKLHDMVYFGYSYSRSIGPIKSLAANSHELMLGMDLKNLGHRETDLDRDGVLDKEDLEPNSPFGAKVDKNGVQLDQDKDGVGDFYDMQANSLPNCPVDKWGVNIDRDRDSVPDCKDLELNTPAGAKVDTNGIAIDSDNDGVIDLLDHQPHTPHWEHIKSKKSNDASKCIVDKNGVACDSNQNGILDCIELLPKDVGIKTSFDKIENYSKKHDYYIVVGVFQFKNNLKRYTQKLKVDFNVSTWTVETDQGTNYVLYKQVYTINQAKVAIEELNDQKLLDYIVGNPWVWQTKKP